MSPDRYTLDDHLHGKPAELVDLFERWLVLVQACGPLDLEATRVGVALRGKRRIFRGARLGRGGIRGYLVLPEKIEGDRRFVKAELLTKKLYCNGFLIRDVADLDATFSGYLHAAYRVGQGENVTRR